MAVIQMIQNISVFILRLWFVCFFVLFYLDSHQKGGGKAFPEDLLHPKSVSSLFPRGSMDFQFEEHWLIG